MPTQALGAYGIELRLSDGIPLGSVTVTGATNASPIVLTTGTPHGVVDVSLVTVAGVGGNSAANGQWIAQAVDSTHLTLRESVGNGAYTSGGTVQRPGTFAEIAEVTNIEDAGVTAALVETSAHDGSGWTSRVPTLLDDNAIRLSLNLVPTHPTHNASTGLEHLLLTKQRRDWLIVFPDPGKTTWAMHGYVTSHLVQAPVAGVLTAATTITMTDEPILALAA